MVLPDKIKFYQCGENQVKFNVHSNFCGRKKCVHFSSCGQALRDIDKHRLIDQGLVPIVDIHSSVSCYSEVEQPKSAGKLEMDTTPDWPAQMLREDECEK